MGSDVQSLAVQTSMGSNGIMCFSQASFMVAVAMLTGAAQAGNAQQVVSVAAGVPLHVTVTRTAPMRVGAPVQGVLTAPVWVEDRLVFPEGALVSGTVTALEPAPRGEHIKALLDGDLTPEREAVVNFNTVRLGNADVALDSEARMRQTQTVRFVAQPAPSIRGRLVGMAKDRIASTRTELFAPGKKDRVLRMLYNQLPYHPQRIWRDEDFVADLMRPAKVELPDETKADVVENAELAGSLPPKASVNARLVTGLDSNSAKKGEVVKALVTQPVYTGEDAGRRLVLPEGTELEGIVTGAKPSRSFGRNGQMRFAFRTVQRPDEEAQTVHGTLTGAEGSEQGNLAVDAEGNVKAQPAKNRFAAPLLLAALAAGGHDDDGGVGRQVVAANGLGLIARVVALAANNRNVSMGFGAYGFAKSVYFRFVARGHAVTFPKDTLIEVQLSGR